MVVPILTDVAAWAASGVKLAASSREPVAMKVFRDLRVKCMVGSFWVNVSGKAVTLSPGLLSLRVTSSEAGALSDQRPVSQDRNPSVPKVYSAL
ncbi:hypothetical protein SKTS_01950 [Sulfurimicrobium lacus]|uniref:Uncharacterized protein n=1 Tax=Sulfurimicrobium lacus TaxID=2715678 RepID=A0A6F8V961_9PROT|nr:hypothetical protein SKTS_01950 [Sulfurimicrobium lacus]